VVAKLSNVIIGRYFVASILSEVVQYVLLHTPTVWLSVFSLTLPLKGTCVDHLGWVIRIRVRITYGIAKHIK
jgi:hypothetical protein